MSDRRRSCLAAALLCGVGGSALTAADSHAQEARAAYAYVTANLNQRAGPGTRFPALAIAPERTQVTINGCLEDLSWCEGAYGDLRGWMSADYLRLYDYTSEAWVEVDEYDRATRLARYGFDLERYWAAHYSDRPFYPERAAWVVAPRSPAVDTAMFYRELSPHGRWTRLEGRYVFMPEVREGWRPYTEGRWQYTQRYGWTWVSNEPFGWATYHYGRWAYSNRLGWVWVPGTQWAPAWVAWRGSEDHLAWAPLPPDAGPGSSFGDNFEEIPSYYWQVVAAASFLRPNLADDIIRDDGDRRRWLDRARPIGNVTVVNNTIVNNVINIDYVEQKTRERVVPREVVITNDARQETESPDEVVRIYQPAAREAPAAETPPAVLPAEVAAEQSQTAGQAGDEPDTEDRVAEAPPEETAPPTEAPPLAPEESVVDEPAQAAPTDTAAEEPPPPADGPPPPTADMPPPPADDDAPPADAPPAAEQPAPSGTDEVVGEEPAPPPPTDAGAAEPPPPGDDAAPPDEAPPAADEPSPPGEPPPAAAEEPAPPADAPPPAEPPPPPAAEELAPPADAPPAAEAPPPPPAADEPVAPAEPPPPAADEPAPPADAPPPPADAPPPPAADEPVAPAEPPPPAAEEPAPPADAPPPAAEAPPPPPAADEPAPPAEPPPPAAGEPAPPADAPPPPAEAPPPPPAADEPAPPAEPPPAVAEEPAPPVEAPPPPAEAPPPAAEEPPAAERAQPSPQDCGEGMRMNRQGECVPRRNQNRD